MPEANYLLSVSWGYIKVCMEIAIDSALVQVFVQVLARFLPLCVCSAVLVVWVALRNVSQCCVWGASTGMLSFGFPLAFLVSVVFNFTQM